MGVCSDAQPGTVGNIWRVRQVADRRNSTLIFPLPIELMRLVDTVRAYVDRQTSPVQQ